MKVIDIQIPEECALEGWNRHVFVRRIRSSLNGSYFSVCGLDRCRSAVAGPGDPGNEKLQEELRAYHCVNYNDMAPDEAAILAQKVAEFVGVRLKVKPSSPIRMHPAVMGACAVVAIAVVSASGLTALNARPSSTPTVASLPDFLAKLPVKQPLPLQSIPLQQTRGLIGAEAESVETVDPVMTLTMNTNVPRDALRRAAGLAARYKAPYTVTVSIAPAGAPGGLAEKFGRQAE